MKYLKQIFIILLFSLLGELCKAVLPFSIPTSIYGMVLLFVALCFGLVKVDMIKETSDFLLGIMPLLFVPAGVKLIGAWGVLEPVLVPVIVIMIVTTVIVMAVSGMITQLLLK